MSSARVAFSLSVDTSALEAELRELAAELGVDLEASDRIVELARDVAAGRPATLEEALSALSDAGLPTLVVGDWHDAYGTLEEWLELDPLSSA